MSNLAYYDELLVGKYILMHSCASNATFVFLIKSVAITSSFTYTIYFTKDSLHYVDLDGYDMENLLAGKMVEKWNGDYQLIGELGALLYG